MDGLMGPRGDSRHDRDDIGEHQLLEVLPLGRVSADLIDPLRAKQILKRGPDHHSRRAPLDEAIQYALG